MRAVFLGTVLSATILLIGTKAGAQLQTSGTSSGTPTNNLAGPELSAAMSAAQQPKNQATASHVFCYCGCDREHGHKSLLDCYRTGHIPVCKTCQGEFIRVGQLNNQGATLGQIQNDIDGQYSSGYPYPQPSPILRQYLAGKANPGAM
jgi:hypothetical protein